LMTFHHGVVTGINAVAREGHEHSTRRDTGHNRPLVLELRPPLQVTDVTINKAGGRATGVFARRGPGSDPLPTGDPHSKGPRDGIFSYIFLIVVCAVPENEAAAWGWGVSWPA